MSNAYFGTSLNFYTINYTSKHLSFFPFNLLVNIHLVSPINVNNELVYTV